jgi:hypothetical protein
MTYCPECWKRESARFEPAAKVDWKANAKRRRDLLRPLTEFSETAATTRTTAARYCPMHSAGSGDANLTEPRYARHLSLS